jgi:two-component system cell cycle sensor histidine kinase PleC
MKDPDDAARHLVGIAVDVTEQRGLKEQNATAKRRLRDAVDAISEAFVLWDSNNNLVLLQFEVPEAARPAGRRVAPGRAMRSDGAGAARPWCSTRSCARSARSGARTFEARLNDGRWLQINERPHEGRRLRLGRHRHHGLKRHEQRLVESERELIATVSDLKQSRQKLEAQAQQLAGPRRALPRPEGAGREREPRQVRIPRQYEP